MEKALFKERLSPVSNSPTGPTIIVELLCSGCHKILKRQENFTEVEERAYKGLDYLKPQTCNTQGIKCKRFE